jgi:hypothetical protein
MIEGACHCGAVRWQFAGRPDEATACNCTVCRRYGVLWAYDYENEGIRVSGPTRSYARGDRDIAFHFCTTCGCVAFWRATATDASGRRRIAVNLRLAEPDDVATVTLRRFDGLATFDDLPLDGRTVGDVWF